MNIPKEYDDEAGRLLTHPLLLPKEDISGIMSAADNRGSTELTLTRYSYVPHTREEKIIDKIVQTIAWIWRVPHPPSP